MNHETQVAAIAYDLIGVSVSVRENMLNQIYAGALHESQSEEAAEEVIRRIVRKYHEVGGD